MVGSEVTEIDLNGTDAAACEASSPYRLCIADAPLSDIFGSTERMGGSGFLGTSSLCLFSHTETFRSRVDHFAMSVTATRAEK